MSEPLGRQVDLRLTVFVILVNYRSYRYVSANTQRNACTHLARGQAQTVNHTFFFHIHPVAFAYVCVSICVHPK